VSARRYRYTGKERDEETGLYYNGARYLAAWLGRWTSADPIGMQAGVNLYQYCRGSPINYVDPSGTDDVPATRALNEPHNTLPGGLIIPTHDDTNWSEDKSIGTRIGELIDSLDLTANEPGQSGNATPLISNADLSYGIKLETWRLEGDPAGTDDQGHSLWEQDGQGQWQFIGDSGRYFRPGIGTSDVEMYVATAGVGEVVGAVGSRLSAALSRGVYAESAIGRAAGALEGVATSGERTIARVGSDARVGTVISPPAPGQIIPGEMNQATQVVAAEGHGWQVTGEYFTMGPGQGANLPSAVQIDDAVGHAIAAERALIPEGFIYYGPGARTPQLILTPPVNPSLSTAFNSLQVEAPTFLSDIMTANPNTIVTWAACRMPTSCVRVVPGK